MEITTRRHIKDSPHTHQIISFSFSFHCRRSSICCWWCLSTLMRFSREESRQNQSTFTDYSSL